MFCGKCGRSLASGAGLLCPPCERAKRLAPQPQQQVKK